MSLVPYYIVGLIVIIWGIFELVNKITKS
jgi:hypothetical protein